MSEVAGVNDANRVFHAHLDSCRQCREKPFGLCVEGAVLLQKVAEAEEQRIQQRVCSFVCGVGAQDSTSLPQETHQSCRDPASCGCECLGCKRVWWAAGRPLARPEARAVHED